MDGATRKLVNEAWAKEAWPNDHSADAQLGFSEGFTRGYLAALEAAPRPPVSPEEVAAIARAATAHNYGQTVYDVIASGRGVELRMSSWPRCREAQRALVEAGYVVAIENRGVGENWIVVTLRERPPVSPELREAIQALRAIEEADRVDHRGHVGDDGEPCGMGRTWMTRMGRDLAAALDHLDAILARFSVPSQPVYDEEKIARFLWRFHPDSICDHWDWLVDMHPALAAEYRRRAAALVAALRGGELTREETNE